MDKKRFFVALRVATSDGPRYAVRRWDTYHCTIPTIISLREAADIARVSKRVLVSFIETGFIGVDGNTLDISAWVLERQRDDNKRRRRPR